MLRRCYLTLFLLSVFISITATGFSGAQIGRLLEEAMAARETSNVSDVSEKFLVAAAAASSCNQRSNVLFIFSDYLIDRAEWQKVIEVQNRIIEYGSPSNQACAFYNLIRANLELNVIAEARKAVIDLNACPAGESMREYARSMKKLAPGSIDARIADLLAEAGTKKSFFGSLKLKTTMSSSAQIAKSPVAYQPMNEAIVVGQEATDRNSVKLGGWNSALRGSINSQGMSLNFGNDLSSKRKTFLTLGTEISTSPGERFRATYVNISFNGTLNKNFVHSGKTYNPGAEIYLRSKVLDIEGFRELRQRSRMNYGILYGIMLVDSDLAISQNIPGIRQITTWRSRFGYPYLGVAAKSNRGGKIGWEASGKFFVWNGDGKYHTRDLELRLLFGQGSKQLSSKIKFRGYLGYRDFCWDGYFHDDRIKLSFSGPVLGLEFFF